MPPLPTAPLGQGPTAGLPMPLPSEMDAARQKLKELTEQVLKYGAAVGAAAGSTAVSAWRAVTVSVTGFAAAGIHGSAMGEALSLAMERLSRGIAGLVAPEIRKLTDLVYGVTNSLAALDPVQKETLASWVKMSIAGLTLSRLFGGWIGFLGGLVTGFGQTEGMTSKFSETGKRLFAILEKLTPALEAIADVVTTALSAALDVINALLETGALKWIAAAGAALLFGSIAVKVVAAVTTIITALKALTAAKILALAYSGPAGWAALAAGAAIGGAAIYGAVKMFNAFGDAAEGGRKKHVQLREEVAKRVGGAEDFAATWARIAAVSINVGQGARQVPEDVRTLTGSLLEKEGKGAMREEFQRIIRATERTADAIERQRPAIGK